MALKINNRKGEIVRDPHEFKKKYQIYCERFSGVTQKNKTIIFTYLKDMELGRNTSGQKGERSYSRLCALLHRMKKLCQWIEKEYQKNLEELTDLDLAVLFKKLYDGEIVKVNGNPYKCTVIVFT